MPGVRLRTKFLLSLIAVSVGLTCASLLVVRHVVQKETRREIFSDVTNSALTFRNAQQQREAALSRSADLLANLPTLRALMTTRDEATIQDASTEFWRLAGSDVFVLADPFGRVEALHTNAPGLTLQAAQDSLTRSLADSEPIHWWLAAGHLCEVFIQPLYFGPPADNKLLGLLVTGYEIDAHVAAEVGRIANSQVAFEYGNAVVVSTLSPPQTTDLVRHIDVAPVPKAKEPSSVQLKGEEFLLTSVPLTAGSSSPVRLIVVKSYDQATSFLRRLNRLLLALGLLAIIAGGAMGSVISHTFTRPLKDLVLGVRSLEKGDFDYPLAEKGDDEVAEVTGAFKRMRETLQQAQHQLLEAERLATIGQMATSISHDLRHSLTAVEANAEFLCDSGLNSVEREQLYQEIRIGVNQMTDLIDSMVEFSKTRESLHLVYANLEESAQRAIDAVRAHPDVHRISIKLTCEGSTNGWFDSRRLERVFYNLLRNACEALPADSGRVGLAIQREVNGALTVRVADTGCGIPDPIRDTLFQPFVSHGKENGTGLGLAVVHKIVRDHGGDVAVESTSTAGTVFKVVLPVDPPRATVLLENRSAETVLARHRRPA